MINSPAVAKLSLALAAVLRKEMNVPEPTAQGGDLPSLVSSYWKIDSIIDAPDEGARTRRHPLNRGQQIYLQEVSLSLYRQIMALTGLSIHPAWQCVVAAARIEEAGGDITSAVAIDEISRLKGWADGLGFREQIILERWMVEEGATA